MANKKITKWEPDDFELEMTTVWSFPDRGNWATHDAKWRGSFGGNIYRYNGSHGCVNLPLKKAQAIYENIEVGTPVIVYSDDFEIINIYNDYDIFLFYPYKDVQRQLSVFYFSVEHIYFCWYIIFT